MEIDRLNRRYALFQADPILELALLPDQGYCNLNYQAVTKHARYLIRKLKPNALDRTFEYKTQQKAYARKIAAKPLHFDLLNHVIIAEFAQGEHRHTLTPRELRTLALSLRKLHKIKLRKSPYNLKKEFRPKEVKAHKALRTLQREPRELVLTHHDLNPRNILFHQNKITLIDWEYTGVNDRYFDLATIASEFRLSPKEERYFLQRYFQNHTRINLKKLRAYKELYQILCSLWFENLEQK